MALTKCSECGRDVSTLATSCPNCGAPVKPASISSSTAVASNPKRKPWLLWLVCSLIGVAALAKVVLKVADLKASSKPHHINWAEELNKNPHPALDKAIDKAMDKIDLGRLAKDVAAKHPEIVQNAAARATTVAHLVRIGSALGAYKQTNGSYPTNEQGLSVLVSTETEVAATSREPVLAGTLKDGWGSDYVYRNPGAKHPDSYDLFSAGPDRLPDTHDDVWGD